MNWNLANFWKIPIKYFFWNSPGSQRVTLCHNMRDCTESDLYSWRNSHNPLSHNPTNKNYTTKNLNNPTRYWHGSVLTEWLSSWRWGWKVDREESWHSPYTQWSGEQEPGRETKSRRNHVTGSCFWKTIWSLFIKLLNFYQLFSIRIFHYIEDQSCDWTHHSHPALAVVHCSTHSTDSNTQHQGSSEQETNTQKSQ